MSTAPLTFTGVSSYSNDLQTILQRAVSIAQLPVKKLQNDQTENLGKKAALVAINPAVANLGSAVAALGSLAANGGGLVASSSDSSLVSVTSTGASAPSTYTISNIQSLASATWATTSGFADNKVAASANGHVDLTVGSAIYHLNLTGTGKNNLPGLASAINSAGAGVTATILTAGSSNYLSISATLPGQAAIQLKDIPTPVDRITNTGTGTDTSVARYADTTTTPVSVSGTMSLVVNSTIYSLNVSGANNLTGLRDAINSAGAGVTATLSSDADGNFLTIATDDLSAKTLQLNDTSKNLISSSDAGTNADFMLNGTIHVVRSSNFVNDIIPGVTFTLLEKPASGSVTLSVAAQSSQFNSALQTFVNNYNTLADQAYQQIGPSAGPLGGDPIIHDILSDTQRLAGYWNPSKTSTVRSLTDLGISFDTTGHMSFNQNVFNGLSNVQLADAMKFLGSSKSGFAALANNFSQLSDPVAGLIRVQEDGDDRANTRITNQIDALNDRVDIIQSTMTAKIQIADALLAQLQSQQNTVNASVQSLNYVAFGKIVSSNGG